MYAGKTLFAQLMDFLPWTSFARIVERYDGNRRVRTLPCTEHFRVLAFAQLTYRESLRDIEACLCAQSAKLYHMGIRSPVRRSTLADANERRDWRMYAEFAQRLIAQARRLYAEEDLGLELSNTVYALDSTTIDLCLSLFPWAPFRRAKAAVKMHTLLDLRGSIPSFIHVSDGKLHDVNAPTDSRTGGDLRHGPISTSRGCSHCTRRARSSSHGPSRTPTCAGCTPRDRAQGIVCDQTVALSGFYSRRKYPHHLRRIRFKDPDTGHTLVFLTNLFGPTPKIICELYKARWQVELFFKWIKQHLRIKKFYGTSENAVKSQIWVAVSVYVLVAIIRKRLDLDAPLYTLLQILSVTLFEKMTLNQRLFKSDHASEQDTVPNQLNLFKY